MKIPYLDLHLQYQSIKSEIDSAVRAVIDSSAFVLGPAVGEFEKAFAGYCRTKYCIGVNSGSNALLLALKALDIGPGDEVITAVNTFVATVSAIIHAGAKPALVDVDPDSCNIDPGLLPLALSRKTRAVIPVHLYGRMSDMDRILRIAGKHSIAVLEDAAQAHGARYKDRPAGSIGQAAAFSFYPAKNLGAFGEGGAVTTNDAAIDRQIRMLRDHGSAGKYSHELVGYNARMDGIQGAILNVKLKHLDRWNNARNRIAGWYHELLQNLPIRLPSTDDDYRQVFHLYVIETGKREQLQQYLTERGVPTLVHYPIPIHLQRAFEYLGYRTGDFPVAEKLACEVLSLPIYPELTRQQVEYICEKISDFFNGR